MGFKLSEWSVVVLFHKIPKNVWCVWWVKQAQIWSPPRLPGGARTCEPTWQDQENFYLLLFLSPLLPVKDRGKWNQFTPSKHFSGFNSVLYFAIEILWFTEWTSVLTERASFGWEFLTSVCLCVVFFCRLFDFLNVTTELLFEFLNYCRSNQGMLRSSMKQATFQRITLRNSPERAHGEIVFLQLQGTVTELVILGAGLSLGLVPIPARLQQCRGGWAGRCCGHSVCRSPAGHWKLLCAPAQPLFVQPGLPRERGQGSDGTAAAAAHRAPFQQLRDSHGVPAGKNSILNRISKVHLWKNSSSVLKIHLKISSERSFSVESKKHTVPKEIFLVFGLPLTPKGVSFNSEHVCIDLLCVCTSATTTSQVLKSQNLDCPLASFAITWWWLQFWLSWVTVSGFFSAQNIGYKVFWNKWERKGEVKLAEWLTGGYSN